jgi:hypothetical protein
MVKQSTYVNFRCSTRTSLWRHANSVFTIFSEMLINVITLQEQLACSIVPTAAVGRPKKHENTCRSSK